jgi:Arc/MetJ-type ribon-helix-helix transcriptional regulator
MRFGMRCGSDRYGDCVVQIVTTVDDALAKDIDALIAGGMFTSRSEVVRAGLARVVEDANRATAAESILAGYQQMPETAEELEQARRATIAMIAMIAEEPW